MAQGHEDAERSDRLPVCPLSWVRLHRACLLILTILILALQFAVQSAPAANSHHVVVINQLRYQPPSLTVRVGDEIEWKNEGIFSHTVTANDGSFDSGLIDPGHSWQMTIKKTGTIAYHCRPHPNMTAELIVQGPGGQGTQPQPRPAQEAHGLLNWRIPKSPEQFHPILVNFTAALVPLALLSDVLGRIFRRAAFYVAGFWMVLYAAVITPFTAAAGWWWKSQVGHNVPAQIIAVHQWLGTSIVVLFVILAIWRGRIYKRDATPSWTYLGYALLVVVALVYQGSLGGAMAFGL